MAWSRGSSAPNVASLPSGRIHGVMTGLANKDAMGHPMILPARHHRSQTLKTEPSGASTTNPLRTPGTLGSEGSAGGRGKISIAVLRNWHGKLNHDGLFWRRAKGTDHKGFHLEPARVVRRVARAARMFRCRIWGGIPPHLMFLVADGRLLPTHRPSRRRPRQEH